MKVHVEERITAYFEGRLTVPSERDALFGHLDRCTACREYFDSLAEADRLLFDADDLTADQLEVLREGVLEPEEVAQKHRLGARWWMDWLVPAAISAIVLFLALPTSEWRAKGGTAPVKPTVEVLCFDDQAKVVAHLETSGVCPAPGFIKVIYASAETVPHLTVAARVGRELRFVSTQTSPEARSVIPEHAAIEAGETIDVVLLTDDPPIKNETILEAPAFLSVQGRNP